MSANPPSSSEKCPYPLTVVVPVFNEVQTLPAVFKDLEDHVLNLVPQTQVIFINDGSQDGSSRLLDQWAGQNPARKVIHQKNSGHGASLLEGLRQSQGDILFLIDSDRQIPLEIFPSAWKAMAEHDAVFGVRSSRQDPVFRIVLSQLVRMSLFLIFGVKLRDANVPFKLVRRSLWVEASHHIPEDTLAPSLFLALFAKRSKRWRVKEMTVPHRVRQGGVASLNLRRLIPFCLKGFGQLIRFRLGAA